MITNLSDWLGTSGKLFAYIMIDKYLFTGFYNSFKNNSWGTQATLHRLKSCTYVFKNILLNACSRMIELGSLITLANKPTMALVKTGSIRRELHLMKRILIHFKKII